MCEALIKELNLDELGSLESYEIFMWIKVCLHAVLRLRTVGELEQRINRKKINQSAYFT